MPRRTRSLRARAAVATALPMAAILLVNGLWLGIADSREWTAEIESDAVSLARHARQPLAGAFDTGKIDAMAIEMLAQTSAVDELRVVGSDGVVRFDTTGRSAGQRVEDSRLLAALRSRDPRLGGTGERRWVALAAPPGPTPRDYGFVLGVSYTTVSERLRKTAVSLTAMTLLSVALAVGFGTALASRLIRPLERLAAGAETIAEGDYQHQLKVRSGDEVEVLADRLNHMAARLHENIAQLEQSNQQLGAANRELTELDQMKSDLLANVSHELRTPLTAIKGYTDYLLDRKLGAINQNQQKGLLVVQRNLERLSRSIDALLDYSRLEAGRIELNSRPFSLVLLVDQVQQTLRSMAERKSVQLSAELEPGLPEVKADREKLRQVLENLIVNAIKFTPGGGSVTVAARAADPELIQLEVRDSGIGISEEQVERIFDRFHQVDGSARRRFSGVGLGLAIVKGILDAHGSEVTVSSAAGQGTSFRFTLPVAEPAPSSEPAPSPDGEAPPHEL